MKSNGHELFLYYMKEVSWAVKFQRRTIGSWYAVLKQE